MTYARAVLALALTLLIAPLASAQLPAFPGALGFGAVATGGRGGRVLHVTTLAASGEGSLAWAAAQSGPRYVVFDVSGVIEGDVEITSGDITIAGQTAPGAGITIRGHLFTPYGDAIENIVVRHVRVRPGPAGGDWPPAGHDAIQMSDARRVIFDHVDVSHGIDELVDHWNGGSEITWQSSLLSFPDPAGGHPEGAHPYCLINSDGGSDFARGGRISVVGNLFAHCRTRTPALSVGPAEVINNVVFDAREAFVHHNPASGDFVIAGNVYLDGPSMRLAPFWFDPENDAPVPTRYFLGDNLVEDPDVFEGVVDDPWTTPGFADEYSFALDSLAQSQFMALAAAPSFGADHVAVARVASAEALDPVLDCAGAWPRDHVSRTAVEEARGRTGMIRQLALGDLLDGLTPGAPPADLDRDGIADTWESAHGLDPSDPEDFDGALEGGWPAIELYLDEVASALVPCEGGPGPMPPGDAGTPMPGTDGGMAGTDGGTASGPDGGSRADGGSSAPADDEVGGGCGCRAPGGRPGSAASAFAAGAVLVLALVRRRRR